MSYLHILSSDLRRCVECYVYFTILKKELLANSLNLSCFDLGSNVTRLYGKSWCDGWYPQNAGVLAILVTSVSIFNHLPRMFLSTDFAFRITNWTCYHGPHLHAILNIISRGVSGLATDFPCGVWGRGWTTCFLHDSIFSAHISKWELVCKFGVIFHTFIISCLG